MPSETIRSQACELSVGLSGFVRRQRGSLARRWPSTDPVPHAQGAPRIVSRFPEVAGDRRRHDSVPRRPSVGDDCQGSADCSKPGWASLRRMEHARKVSRWSAATWPPARAPR
jgi:hypothetical protein